jgi:hypothetical protein
MNPFDFINSVTFSKENLIAADESVEREYNPFVVNRGLSYYPDTIFYANSLNCHPSIDKKLQYEYYLFGIPKRKRFSKWHKKDEVDSLELVKQVYNYSDQKAKEALRLLTPKQIESLRELMNTGGT